MKTFDNFNKEELKKILLERLPDLINNQEVGILCDTDLGCSNIFTHDTSEWEIVTIEDNVDEIYVEVLQRYKSLYPEKFEPNLYRIWVDKKDLI